MKIYIPGLDRDDTGGGSTFCRNIKKGLAKFGHDFVGIDQCDVVLIAGATLCERQEIESAKQQGKQILLRVDNILEDGRNRNTGMSRMMDFAHLADVVIYQSEWAKKLLSPICGDGLVIHNGVDIDVFRPTEGDDHEGLRVFYSRWGRGDGKNLNVVQYLWREHSLQHTEDTLVLVGNFGKETTQVKHPFEFHNNEVFEFHGQVKSQETLAKIISSCDVALLPYDYDACSNTVLEVQACGVPVLYSETGGTPDIVDYGLPLDRKLSLAQNIDRVMRLEMNYTAFEEKFSLDEMARKYHAVFTILTTGQHDV